MIPDHLNQLLQHYGYGVVFVTITLEATGLPLPGESMLIAAALYAATTHGLRLSWLIPVASAGAIMGDNIGYVLGRWAGTALLERYGRRVGLTAPRLRLGQFLFRRYGGGIVFFGRFIAVLRTFAALLAGATRMHWARFLLWNALGGIAWCTSYTSAAYALGNSFQYIKGPLGIALGVAGAAAVVAAAVFLRRNERRLTREAEAEMGREGDAA